MLLARKQRMIEGLLTNKVGYTINGCIVTEALIIFMEETTCMGVGYKELISFQDLRRIMITIQHTQVHRRDCCSEASACHRRCRIKDSRVKEEILIFLAIRIT
jgi:hypothetical protein